MPTLIVTIVVVALASPGPGRAEAEVRIATYNIKFLDADKLGDQGSRRSKLEQVIERLGSDVIALQEIDDRAALREIFPESDWQLVIDDDSGELQDVALAVRKSLEIAGMPQDLDAEDEHFLFPEGGDDFLFPDRRDVLQVQIRVPGEDTSFHVLVVHAKSRFGGRTATDGRRIAASRALIRELEALDGQPYVLLGDFNDTPDDESLNILEAGDPGAAPGPEARAGPFLINITEPLYAAGHVTYGRKSNDVEGEVIDTVDPRARDRNNDARGSDEHTGDQMFDQLLLSPALHDHYIPNSAEVLDAAFAALGNSTNRASDHLPVFADLFFADGETPPPPAPAGSLRVGALLPNPDGPDKNNEAVTIRNDENQPQPLEGWSIRDLARNRRDLSGTVPALGELEVTLSGRPMLNNNGDEIALVDPQGAVAHEVRYEGAQAGSGDSIRFE